MQLKVKKHELRLLLQCIPILTFATLASLGSLLPSVVQFSAAVILAGQVVFIFGTKGIKKNIGLLWIPSLSIRRFLACYVQSQRPSGYPQPQLRGHLSSLWEKMP